MSDQHPGTRPDGASHDPRMHRLGILRPEADANLFTPEDELEHWQTYEVFHQKSRGDQHAHVGIVHAPNPEMALLFAKEQYARRMKCVNLWVVKTADVHATDYDDEDMFEPATDKSYREAYAYKTRDLITAYKKAQGQSVAPEVSSGDPGDHYSMPAAPASGSTTAGDAPRKPKIILGKKKS